MTTGVEEPSPLLDCPRRARNSPPLSTIVGNKSGLGKCSNDSSDRSESGWPSNRKPQTANGDGVGDGDGVGKGSGSGSLEGSGGDR